MNIEIICKSSGIFGGVKRLYRIASYLMEEGHTVAMNMEDGSRNTWFSHEVPENQPISPDIRICPETCQRPHLSALNILYIQAQFDMPEHVFDKVITTTQFLSGYLRDRHYPVDYIIPYGFDPLKFKEDPSIRIKHRIGMMPRKGKQECDLLLDLCKNEDVMLIDGLSEEDTIKSLQSCDYFFAISRVEGFGMPPFEAALCGNLIIGYHGKGGRTWLTAETFAPCEFPQDFLVQLALAKTGAYETQRNNLKKVIAENLTLEMEKQAWSNVINEFN